MLDPARIRESIRNRPLVRQQTPIRGRELIGYLTLCSLIALPAVFLLWQQNAYVRTRFEIESLRKEKLALQERYRCLRIETGTLESLDRIEHEAIRNGLVPRDQASPAFILSGGAPRMTADGNSTSTPDAERVAAAAAAPAGSPPRASLTLGLGLPTLASLGSIDSHRSQWNTPRAQTPQDSDDPIPASAPPGAHDPSREAHP